MKKFLKNTFVFFNFILFIGCGGGSTSTIPSTSDSIETRLLKSLIVGKTLHEYDGFIYHKYEFKSNGDAQYYIYFDDETYNDEHPWSGSGNAPYTILNGVFTLTFPASSDICTLESNTSTQVNMKCKDAQNLIFWTTKSEAKNNPFDRN